MTDYLSGWNALIDPEQAGLLADGRRRQDITPVLTDAPRGADTRRPAALTLRPAQARELACELLCLAERAERTELR
jgi:hypothetical protein